MDAQPPIDGHRDEIGELTRAFASMHSQLRRQESARRAFVATASHELRTPLTSLDGMLELLEDDLNADNLDLVDARKRTARAKEQSTRLSALAGDLLDLSRMDAQLDLRREPLELGELCRAVAAEFELRAAGSRVRLDVRHTPSACWVSADPGAVARIIRILLDNALRVSPPGSTISVEMATHRGWATATVSDDGPGVAADERELIFERFQRGSATGGRAGFGLGLAIGRELAERMGGALEVEDAAAPGPGEPPAPKASRGARFTLRLPVAEIASENGA
jgi:signal transduction histidine kinase